MVFTQTTQRRYTLYARGIPDLLTRWQEVIDCSTNPTCEAGRADSKAYAVTWTASASAGGWTSGGFEVTEEWSTGNSYTCAGTSGDEICVWYKIAHTEYEVIVTRENSCSGEKQDYGEPYRITAPNAANRGGRHYCVIGTCRAQGDQYWQEGAAGGP